MKPKIKRAILIVLLAWDGLPMGEESLVSAAQLALRPGEPTRADVEDALKDCEAEGYLSGVTDELTRERSWTLTEKGTHKARQLR